MDNKTYSSNSVLLMFFLSYSFYSIQIVSQLLFKMYSKQAVGCICLFFLIFPLISVFICKRINRQKENESIKDNKVLSFVTSLYLVITTIISMVYVCNIILIYYYQQSSIVILLLFLTLPIIYTIIKGTNHFFSLASIILIIYIFFKYSYLSNFSTMDFYVLDNLFSVDKSNILGIIIYSLPILLEPIILFNEGKRVSNKINIKLVVFLSIFLSLIGVITILRETLEFGNLLSMIRFPYLESAKNIMAGRFFENIDYYYLLSLSVSIYIRLGFTIVTIKNSFNLNKKVTLTILSMIIFMVYIIHLRLEIGEYLNNKLLFISSVLLVLVGVIALNGRRIKNE